MRMHQSPIWFCFIAIVGLFTAGYLAICGIHLYHYSQLNESAVPKRIVWSVKKVNDETFVPSAEYAFMHGGKEFHGRDLLAYEKYRNEQALNQALPKYQNLEWRIWYHAENPVFSALEKTFPMKECIYASILTTLFIYFLGLGLYVGNRQR